MRLGFFFVMIASVLIYSESLGEIFDPTLTIFVCLFFSFIHNIIDVLKIHVVENFVPNIIASYIMSLMDT